MANPILESLRAEVARNKDVDASAAALIRGITGRIEAAIAKALQNGATAAELAPLTAEVTAMKASNDDLAAAVTENTPAEEPPETPPGTPPTEPPPSDPASARR